MKHRSWLRPRLRKDPVFRGGQLFVFCLTLALIPHLNSGLLLAASPSLADRVIEHKLANGLPILMVERHQTPVVSINITFAVGGINEQVGQTGLAHLYEHMAFKGTRLVGTTNYEKEKPILDELALVGTELDQRQRDLADKGEGATAEERAVVESLQNRLLELQTQAAQ